MIQRFLIHISNKFKIFVVDFSWSRAKKYDNDASYSIIRNNYKSLTRSSSFTISTLIFAIESISLARASG